MYVAAFAKLGTTAYASYQAAASINNIFSFAGFSVGDAALILSLIHIYYGEEPSPELLDPYTQRIKSYPWKFIFTMVFVVLDIKLVIDDWQFAVAAVCAVWLLLEMSIADIKYRIVPDQFIMLLAVSALGFIPYHGSWRDCLFGGLAGFCIMFPVSYTHLDVYKRQGERHHSLRRRQNCRKG